MDKIYIKDLKVFANHGVYEEENIRGQYFYVDAELFLDCQQAAVTDDLSESVNYGAVCRLISRVMRETTDCLIERVAYRIILAILHEYDKIKSVKVELKKPEAPIGMELAWPSVTLERGWEKVYVGVGSNLGDKEACLDLAGRRISQNPAVRNFRAAKIIETAPYGYVDQDSFLNTVYEFETYLQPKELLHTLWDIEQEAGRTRQIHWGPRTLDLDVLMYGNLVSEDPELILPHPDMENRSFVLEPLCALNPYLVHPLKRQRMSELLCKLKESESKHE